MNKKFTLIAVAAAFAATVFDASALSLALPSIGDFLHANSIADLEWVLSGYVLCFAAFLLTAGRLSDHFGANRVLLIGAVGFGITSLLCAVAQTITWLIAARAGQGLAAALLVTCSYSLIAQLFTVPAERAHAMATLNFCGTIGLVSGPLLGGVLVGQLGWQWIFFPNLGISLLLIVAVLTIRLQAHQHEAAFDISGQLAAAVGLATLAFSLIEGPRLGWSDSTIIASLALCVVSIIVFAVIERQKTDPLIPFNLLTIFPFTVAISGAAIWRFTLYGQLFLFSLYFQHVWGYSVAAAGLAFIPFTAAPFISNALSASLIKRFGAGSTAAFGFGTAAAGEALLLGVSAHGPYIVAGIGMAIVSFGGGFAMPALSYAYTSAVPRQTLGIASGIFNAAGQVAVLLSVAILGALTALSYPTALKIGVSIIIVLLSAGALLALRMRFRQTIAAE